MGAGGRVEWKVSLSSPICICINLKREKEIEGAGGGGKGRNEMEAGLDLRDCSIEYGHLKW